MEVEVGLELCTYMLPFKTLCRASYNKYIQSLFNTPVDFVATCFDRSFTSIMEIQPDCLCQVFEFCGKAN